MKKTLILILLFSLCGFSQTKNSIQIKLTETDTIKSHNKRFKLIKKIVNDFLIENIVSELDTVKVDFSLTINKKGLMIFNLNKINDPILSESFTSFFEEELYVKPLENNNKKHKFTFQLNNYYILNEKGEYKLIKKPTNILPFSVIEQVPIFPNCKGNKQELIKCMNLNIQKHIVKHFNPDFAKNLGLSPGMKRISVQFLINLKGDITDVKSRAPHPKLEREAIRIVKLLPKMTPGKQKGKTVRVRYNLPIVFNVENTVPLTKVQLRELKRKNRKRN